MTKQKSKGADATSRRFADRSHGVNAPRVRWRKPWRTLAISLAAMLAASLAPAWLGVTQAQRLVSFSDSKRTVVVKVAVGKSEDIRIDSPLVDITVGNPDIADVNPLTDHALSVLGKKIGTTRVTVYGENKHLIGIFDIEVSYDISQLAAEISRRFPHAGLKVSSVNGRIMLSGDAPDGMVLDRALTLAKQFGPEVINSVTVAQPQQVMLEVRFIEASRQAGRELGVQWNILPRPGHNDRFLANIGARKPATALPSSNGAPGGVLSISPGAAAGLLGTATPPFGLLVGNLIGKGIQADILVNALEERGLARRLAEPNLVALSGDTASFLAGGEYPIPVPGSFGQLAVEYKRYGVSLAFSPTVLNGSLINLKIEPEVSQLDPSNSVAVGPGIRVPALTVRRASTTIELRDGQSFALAGLLQNEGATAQNQLPWIGDVPILGALFRSASYQKNETDLVIIVTPRLVRPARPGDALKTPLDNTLPANDIDLFLLGKAEVPRKGYRPRDARPREGHILDLPVGGQHASLR
ncbi:MAG: type II and III secretion system protein family protein [Proteobacteria bacterium]|nr:type II and III secretion system protein family protein [Pseudomonadota bacterium]